MITMLAVALVTSFARSYGGEDHDWAGSIAEAQDGGFLVAGSSWGFGSVWIDLLLIKLSASGTTEWAKTVRGDGPEWASEVFQAPDGGFIIAGHTRSFGARKTDLLLVKLTATGNIAWARTIGTEGDDYAGGAVRASDQGYALTGGTRWSPEDWDAFLVKTSGNGDIEWARALDSGGLERGECVVQSSDEGFVVAGWTTGQGAGYSDFLVAKFWAGGALEWFRTYGTPEHDAAHAIVQASDGGFLVAGETWGGVAGTSDILVLKIAADGSLEWGKTYGGPDIDLAVSVAGTSDGGFVVAGETMSFGLGERDLLLMKLDSDGRLEWAETFGGTGSDSVGQVIALSDTDIAIVGSSGSQGADLSDILVIRLPADGSYPGCLAPCELAVADATPSENAPAFVGGAVGFTSSAANPLMISCSPASSDICPPSVEESSRDQPGPVVTCSPVPGGALFVSSADAPLRIYAADGRLAYSVNLQKGENRISLETGVYLWRAQPGSRARLSCMGKTVVR